MPTKTQEATLVTSGEQELMVCSVCLGEFSADDEVYFDDQSICPDCADELTGFCANCGERFWLENNAGDSNITICQRCYDNHFTHCEDCGAVISFNDAYQVDDDDYDRCYSCYHTHDSKRRVIHDYLFKPSPTFFPQYKSNELFLGIELEIDNGGEDTYNARELLNIGNRTDEHIYVKHDGSLNDGMEIVSHPATLEYHTKHIPWAEICRKAVEMGYTSHNAGTAGLHIHVSRSALGDTYQAQDEVIARILYFVEVHFNEMLRFSRRTESQLNRWAARYGYKDHPKDILEFAKNSNLGRYTAVNLQPYDTVEFRIFRGSLKYQTFIAALQLVNHICKAALSMSDDEFRAMSWSGFVAGIYAAQYPELVEYLKIRRLFVNDEITSEEDI